MKPGKQPQPKNSRATASPRNRTQQARKRRTRVISANSFRGDEERMERARRNKRLFLMLLGLLNATVWCFLLLLFANWAPVIEGPIPTRTRLALGFVEVAEAATPVPDSPQQSSLVASPTPEPHEWSVVPSATLTPENERTVNARVSPNASVSPGESSTQPTLTDTSETPRSTIATQTPEMTLAPTWGPRDEPVPPRLFTYPFRDDMETGPNKWI